MQTATKQLWGSILAAIFGSLCCVVPRPSKSSAAAVISSQVFSLEHLRPHD